MMTVERLEYSNRKSSRPSTGKIGGRLRWPVRVDRGTFSVQGHIGTTDQTFYKGNTGILAGPNLQPKPAEQIKMSNQDS